MKLALKHNVATGMIAGYKEIDGKIKRVARLYYYKPTDVPDEEAKILLERYPQNYVKWDKDIQMLRKNEFDNSKRIIQAPPSIAKQPKVVKPKKNEIDEGPEEEIDEDELNDPLMNSTLDDEPVGFETMDPPPQARQPNVDPKTAPPAKRPPVATQPRAQKVAAPASKKATGPPAVPADEPPPAAPMEQV